MSDTLLKEIYQEVIYIRKKIDLLEEIIIPEEKINNEELKEIEMLKKESLKGENIKWDDLKKELNL